MSSRWAYWPCRMSEISGLKRDARLSDGIPPARRAPRRRVFALRRRWPGRWFAQPGLPGFPPFSDGIPAPGSGFRNFPSFVSVRRAGRRGRHRRMPERRRPSAAAIRVGRNMFALRKRMTHARAGSARAERNQAWTEAGGARARGAARRGSRRGCSAGDEPVVGCNGHGSAGGVEAAAHPRLACATHNSQTCAGRRSLSVRWPDSVREGDRLTP